MEDKTSKNSVSKTGTNRQVTGHRAGDAGKNPEHDKLCRSVKLFNEWSKYQQAEHVHQQVKDIDVDEHRCNEAPPLIVRGVDEVIDLGAIRNQYRLRKTSLQSGEGRAA